MDYATYLIVALMGLTFGSFAGAQVWRLRAWQLVEDKRYGEEYDRSELKRLLPLTKRSLRDDRSQCLHCRHELAWYDLLPIVSWLSTGGKCRYCHKSIGWFEPVMELGTASLFILFWIYWSTSHNQSDLLLVIWVPILVMMTILFAYDAKWFLLPDKIMFPMIGLSVLIALAAIGVAENPADQIVNTIAAVGILGGIYLGLWLVSRGAWVGFGDVKLGLALGLLLGSWELAFLTLFLANVYGLIAALPGLLNGKLGRGAHIPFGPMLILGFFTSLFYGEAIITLYVDSLNNIGAYSLML